MFKIKTQLHSYTQVTTFFFLKKIIFTMGRKKTVVQEVNLKVEEQDFYWE